MAERERREAQDSLAEEQNRFMQQVKALMGQRWARIEDELERGKESKKRSELEKTKDLEEQLQRDIDRLVELSNQKSQRDRRSGEDLEKFEGGPDQRSCTGS